MVYKKLTERLAELKGIEKDTIKPESKLSDLGIDSLDVVELTMDLEEEYGVIIELDEIKETVGELAAYIEQKIKEDSK